MAKNNSSNAPVVIQIKSGVYIIGAKAYTVGKTVEVTREKAKELVSRGVADIIEGGAKVSEKSKVAIPAPIEDEEAVDGDIVV